MKKINSLDSFTKVVRCMDSTVREEESFISEKIVISTSTWWE